MAEREKLVYIVLDEANRPTSLGAFEDGDTISSGTLPNNVRTAVEDVDTLNTRVDNLDTSVGNLSTAIDAIEVGAVDASVLAAAQFVTDSSGDIITTSSNVVTLDTRVGNVEASTTDLSTYISNNEATWNAGAVGIDPDLLADITTVSTIVSNTSGANEDIVTEYGAYSGEAVGIRYAYGTFDDSGSIATNLDFNNNDVNNIFNLTAINLTSTGITVNGNISVTGLVDGVDISTRDAFLSSLTTSSEALSGAIDTLDGTLTNVQGSTVALSSYIESNEATWNAGAAGIDPDLLADIQAVSTVVTTTSGANDDIVTSYGPYSGLASGVSAAANVFASVNGTTAVLARSIDGGSYNLTGVNLLGAATANITTGNITTGNITNGNIFSNLDVTGNVSVTGGVSAEGAVSGGSTATFDGQIIGGSLRSGGNITTTAGNISTNNGNIIATNANLIAGGYLSAVGNSNIDGTLTVGLDVTANGVSVTALDDRVTTAEGDITTLQGDVAPVTDLVTAFGPVSGAASGVSGAAAVFASVNGTTAVINRDFDFNSKNITNINSLEAKGGFSLTGSITLDGTVDGVNISDLDSYVTDLATSSEEVSAVVATNTGNISTNTTNITNLTTSSEELSAVITTNTADILALQGSDSFPVTSLTTALNANSNNITNAGAITGTSVSVATVTTDILNATGTAIQVSKDLDLIIDDKTLFTKKIYSNGNLTLSGISTVGILAGTNIVFNNGTTFTANDFGACCLNWNSNYNTAQGYDTVGWDATKTIVDANVTALPTTGTGLGSSGIRLNGVVYPIEQTNPPADNNLLKYNSSTSQWKLGTLAFEVDGNTATVNPAVDQVNLENSVVNIQNNLNVSSPSGTVTFGSQQTFTPSSNTFATRNILIGNELSSGPECVVNLEGSTIWASGSVLSAGSGCDITLRGDKFFYGPTNIYGPLGTDLDLDGNNLIDVNNITTANIPLTLQVTGSVNANALNIKNTSTGISASGAINVEAVGNVSVSAGDTVDITAPTVNLDGTGLFGLSGGAVQIEATSTYVTIDSGAYLNITAATNLNLNSADNGTQSVNIDGCPFPNPFIQIKADTGLNINSAANVAVTFSGVDVSGGGKVANHYSYNFGTTPTSVQVDTAGIYEVSFNIMVYDPASTVAQRSTHIAQITKNGTVVGPGAIGYVRSNSGSNEASYNMNGYIINLASGDDIGVNFERVATATSTTSILPGYDHILTIKRIG